MSVAGESSDIWIEVDDEAAWRRFDSRFRFQPRYRTRPAPAILEPADSITLDLSPVFAGDPGRYEAGWAAVDAASFRAFVGLTGDGELVALDWQHPAYRYAPARHVLSGLDPLVPVFPDGDYHAHVPSDLAWGTFGHPWEESLCIWGEALVDTLGPELEAWLPVLRRGGEPVG